MVDNKSKVGHAAALARTAMRLQRSNDSNVDNLIRQAEVQLREFKKAIADQVRVDAGTAEQIEGNVAPDLEEALPSLREFLAESLAPYGYVLLVFSEDDDGVGRMNYASNVNVEGVVQSMREFIAAVEIGQ